MIVVTGAAGFIGSQLVEGLLGLGHTQLLLVDDFSRPDKAPNLVKSAGLVQMPRDEFMAWFEYHAAQVEVVFHLGARTDTMSDDTPVFDALNLNYSKQVWAICSKNSIPFLYASSAATYGDGRQGFDDSTHPDFLSPLNAYAVSKNEFDKWLLPQSSLTPFWAGFKFFNVYGPNEYHKGRMASVIWHSWNQWKAKGKVSLFRSHHPDYTDGGQLRDFISVEDIVKVLIWSWQNKPASGIYNLGTGEARSFKDLALAFFAALGEEPKIEYIDMPESLQPKYQYYTCATMDKLRKAGYTEPFLSLEEGVKHYVDQLKLR